MAVIGVFEDDNVLTIGVGTSKAKGEFVGFAAGVEEVADSQWGGQKRGETFSVAEDVVVEIAGVGVEQSELLLGSGDYARVGMANEGDVIINVEVSSAIFVVEILAPTANDFQGTLIRDAEIGAEEILSRRKRFVWTECDWRKTMFGDSYDQIWIGRQRGEDVALRRKSDTRKIGGEIEKIKNDLKMEVRGPATIFGGVANAGERLATRYGIAYL